MIETDCLFITDTVHTCLEEAAVMARPLETGGILIGWREDHRVVVVDFIELPSTGRTSSAYQLDPDLVNQALDKYRTFTDDARRGYVGAWHSHPALSPPSWIDRRTFVKASKGNAHSLAYVVVATDGMCVSTYPTVVLPQNKKPVATPYPPTRRAIDNHGKKGKQN